MRVRKTSSGVVKKAEREPARPPARNLKTACSRDSEATADAEATDGVMEAGDGRRRSGKEEGRDGRRARARKGGGGRRAQVEREGSILVEWGVGVGKVGEGVSCSCRVMVAQVRCLATVDDGRCPGWDGWQNASPAAVAEAEGARSRTVTDRCSCSII